MTTITITNNKETREIAIVNNNFFHKKRHIALIIN